MRKVGPGGWVERSVVCPVSCYDFASCSEDVLWHTQAINSAADLNTRKNILADDMA